MKRNVLSTQKHKAGSSMMSYRMLVLAFLIFSLGILSSGCTGYPEEEKTTNPQELTSPHGEVPPDQAVGEQSTSLPPAEPVPPTATSTIELPTPTPSPTIEPTIAPPTPVPPLRFAVIGDYGSGEQQAADVAALVKSWNPEFIVTVGDNNYPDGAAETIDQNIGQFYQEYIFPYQGQYGEGSSTFRFFPTLGNHDWDTQGAQPYLDYFTLPGNERYYDVTWGPVHIFALNSDSREPDGVGRSSIQAQWLKERLAASTLPWKLVVMHVPVYSSGMWGGIDWMLWPFQEWGATAVLSGHDHDYERLIIDGIPYFVNGLGGGEIYYFKDPVPGSQVRYDADYGAMLVTADLQQITFEFYTRWGELIDRYQVVAP